MSAGAIFGVRVVIALLGGVVAWGLAAWRGDPDSALSGATVAVPMLLLGMALSGMEAKRARNHDIE